MHQLLNKTFEELAIEHQHLLVVAIKRDNETIIPNGHDSIQNDDVVFFVTTLRQNKTMFWNSPGKKQFEVKNIMFMGGSRIAQKGC